MNPQNKNNIPQGYKTTPLGIIPQEWEVEPLHYLGQIYSGGTPDTEVEEYWNGDIVWCTPSDITKLTTKYIEYTDVKITDRGLKESSATLLPPQSIVVCTRATIGNAAICTTDIATNQGFKNIIPNKETNSEWLYYMIIYSKPRLVRLGCGSTFLEVSKKDFSRFKILVPPLPEQQKIAEVLGTWDKTIEKQTQLIKKLELRKKGLMQQLLTGKKRLPGFSGEWRKVKLEEIASLYQPQTIQSEDLLSTGFPVYGANGLIGYYKKFNHELPQVVITCRGSSCGTVNYTPEKCWITGNAMVLNVDNNQNINKTFFYYLISNSSFAHLISGSGQPQIVRQPLLKFELLIPTFKEQTAIAQVLTTADREIELAQQKFELLRQQKRGLMQQLLTGKKRVKL